MSQNTQVLRSSGAVRLLGVALYIAGLVMLWFYLPFRIADHHRTWILPLFCLFGALWLLDLFVTLIVLSDESIRIVSVSDFHARTVPRVDVDSVTWEKGCGASIRLRDGQWVRLPSVGRNAQGLTNTIRAWLKRTAVTT